MPRYFVELAYNGGAYSGWQIQPNAITIQEVLEQRFSHYLGEKISIVGCGRTDTGVHAACYVFHFDTQQMIRASDFLFRMKRMLPNDIRLFSIQAVDPELHARFDAISRTYHYYLSFEKPIFSKGQVYYCPFSDVNTDAMKKAAQMLLNFEAFYPFCKSKTQLEHFRCQLFQSNWDEIDTGKWRFTIKANRFLRGMVRLIVGMCINVGRGRITLEEVKKALENQDRLDKPWSAPAEGLFLSAIEYPSSKFEPQVDFRQL